MEIYPIEQSFLVSEHELGVREARRPLRWWRFVEVYVFLKKMEAAGIVIFVPVSRNPISGLIYLLGRKSYYGRGSYWRRHLENVSSALPPKHPKYPSNFQEMTNVRKVPSVEGRMRTMRNSTVKQDTSVFIRGIKESVKGKDSNVEGCSQRPPSWWHTQQAHGWEGTTLLLRLPSVDSHKASVTPAFLASHSHHLSQALSEHDMQHG